MTDTHIEGGRQLRWVALGCEGVSNSPWDHKPADLFRSRQFYAWDDRFYINLNICLLMYRSVRPSLQASLVPSSSNHNVGTHHDVKTFICLPALQIPSDAHLLAMGMIQVISIIWSLQMELGSKSNKKLRKLGHMPNFHYPIYLVSLYGRKKYGHWIKIFTYIPIQEIWTYFRISLDQNMLWSVSKLHHYTKPHLF